MGADYDIDWTQREWELQDTPKWEAHALTKTQTLFGNKMVAESGCSCCGIDAVSSVKLMIARCHLGVRTTHIGKILNVLCSRFNGPMHSGIKKCSHRSNSTNQLVNKNSRTWIANDIDRITCNDIEWRVIDLSASIFVVFGKRRGNLQCSRDQIHPAKVKGYLSDYE